MIQASKGKTHRILNYNEIVKDDIEPFLHLGSGYIDVKGFTVATIEPPFTKNGKLRKAFYSVYCKQAIEHNSLTLKNRRHK